eukprot:scaffold29727_cov20-Tisochrysis_lutea.AAC.1
MEKYRNHAVDSTSSGAYKTVMGYSVVATRDAHFKIAPSTAADADRGGAAAAAAADNEGVWGAWREAP